MYYRILRVTELVVHRVQLREFEKRYTAVLKSNIAMYEQISDRRGADTKNERPPASYWTDCIGAGSKHWRSCTTSSFPLTIIKRNAISA